MDTLASNSCKSKSLSSLDACVCEAAYPGVDGPRDADARLTTSCSAPPMPRSRWTKTMCGLTSVPFCCCRRRRRGLEATFEVVFMLSARCKSIYDLPCSRWDGGTAARRKSERATRRPTTETDRPAPAETYQTPMLLLAFPGHLLMPIPAK